MLKKNLKTFKINYSTNGGTSCIVLITPNNITIKRYQVNMLEENSIRNVLPLIGTRIDDEFLLRYDITSRIEFKRILERKALKKNEFLRLILQMLECLLNCDEYLLNPSSFIFDTSFIYLNPATLEPFMLYVPMESESDYLTEFIGFIRQVITCEALFDTKDEDNYIQKLLDIMKRRNITLQEFINEIRNLLFSPNTVKQSGIFQQESVSKHNFSISNSKRIKEDKEKLKIDVYEKPSATFYGFIMQIIKDTMPYSRLSYLAVFFINAGLLSIWLVLLFKGLLLTGSNIFGSILVTFGVEYFIFTKFFSKDKKKEVFRSLPENFKKQEGKNLHLIKKKIENKSAEKVHSQLVSYSADDDKTIILKNKSNKQEYAFLERRVDGSYEKIYVSQNKFLIGRHAEYVDYRISNSAIGKIHAEILKTSHGYIIKDLNSVNGTYLNGKRIESNREYPLKNTDKVSFANSEYKFIDC